MAFDLRYNLRHIGDIFVDSVQKTAGTAILCSKSLFLAYDIKLLHRKKDQISGNIGVRVAVLIKEGITDISKDVELTEHIIKLNSIEKDIVGMENEGLKLVNPFKIKKKAV